MERGEIILLPWFHQHAISLSSDVDIFSYPKWHGINFRSYNDLEA